MFDRLRQSPGITDREYRMATVGRVGDPAPPVWHTTERQPTTLYTSLQPCII